MKLVKGGLARIVNTNLSLRSGPGTGYKRLAILQRDVLVRFLENPANGWVKVEVNGWAKANDPSKVYSEPDDRSSVEATRGPVEWQVVVLTGYVSAAYLEVVDGPQ